MRLVVIFEEGDPCFKAERRPCEVLVWGKALPDLEAVL